MALFLKGIAWAGTGKHLRIAVLNKVLLLSSRTDSESPFCEMIVSRWMDSIGPSHFPVFLELTSTSSLNPE